MARVALPIPGNESGDYPEQDSESTRGWYNITGSLLNTQPMKFSDNIILESYYLMTKVLRKKIVPTLKIRGRPGALQKGRGT